MRRKKMLAYVIASKNQIRELSSSSFYFVLKVSTKLIGVLETLRWLSLRDLYGNVCSFTDVDDNVVGRRRTALETRARKDELKIIKLQKYLCLPR